MRATDSTFTGFVGSLMAENYQVRLLGGFMIRKEDFDAREAQVDHADVRAGRL